MKDILLRAIILGSILIGMSACSRTSDLDQFIDEPGFNFAADACQEKFEKGLIVAEEYSDCVWEEASAPKVKRYCTERELSVAECKKLEERVKLRIDDYFDAGIKAAQAKKQEAEKKAKDDAEFMRDATKKVRDKIREIEANKR